MSHNDDALDEMMKRARAIVENSKPRTNVDSNLLCELHSMMDSTSTAQVQYSRKPKKHLEHKTNNGNNKLRILITLFSTSLCIWFISLFTVYLPISGWITPTFPYTANAQVLNIFLVSTILATGASLLLGLYLLKEKKASHYMENKATTIFKKPRNLG